MLVVYERSSCIQISLYIEIENTCTSSTMMTVFFFQIFHLTGQPTSVPVDPSTAAVTSRTTTPTTGTASPTTLQTTTPTTATATATAPTTTATAPTTTPITMPIGSGATAQSVPTQRTPP